MGRKRPDRLDRYDWRFEEVKDHLEQPTEVWVVDYESPLSRPTERNLAHWSFALFAVIPVAVTSFAILTGNALLLGGALSTSTTVVVTAPQRSRINNGWNLWKRRSQKR